MHDFRSSWRNTVVIKLLYVESGILVITRIPATRYFNKIQARSVVIENENGPVETGPLGLSLSRCHLYSVTLRIDST